MKKYFLPLGEMVIIVVLAMVPLFVSFPYRVNIFLSWEGAYRMSQGQLPFRDFGIPMGGMYWVIPAVFFKLFGAQMITLVKAQVFINIISGLAFRSILKSCGVQPGIRFACVLLYCLSFSFFNFWPWYNHTVMVYEFIALAFLLKAIVQVPSKWRIVNLVLAAFFSVCSFLTKQDAGGMGFALSFVVLGYACLRNKKWMSLFIYAGSFAVILSLFIAPFLKYGFGYWFNHGQAPHTARVSITELADEFFSSSQWIKFYLFMLLVILVIRFRNWRQGWQQQNEVLFLLLTIGILAEAAVFQVTSYTPPDNNIFFHSFAIACILSNLVAIVPLSIPKMKMAVVCSLGVLLWWSGVYWKYIQRVLELGQSENIATVSPTGENIVNRSTFMIHPIDTTDIPDSKWVFSDLPSFKKIYLPAPTVEGIHRLMNLQMVHNNKNLHVLNMTELTPLAAEMHFQLEKGSEYPLWYHLGVGMFNKQAALFESKIGHKEYDLVLFEYVPGLNNFYPFRVRDSLLVHYNKIDSFPAPRRGSETKGTIEVFTPQ